MGWNCPSSLTFQEIAKKGAKTAKISELARLFRSKNVSLKELLC